MQKIEKTGENTSLTYYKGLTKCFGEKSIEIKRDFITV